MTFCLGIKTENRLICLSGTRLTSGDENTGSKKVSTVRKQNPAFTTAAGLGFVKDNTIACFSGIIGYQHPVSTVWNDQDKTCIRELHLEIFSGIYIEFDVSNGDS